MTRRQEFKTLGDSNEVYKLIGPVLVKQDVSEAKSTVDKRLEFIQSEMYGFFHSPLLHSLSLYARIG